MSLAMDSRTLDHIASKLGGEQAAMGRGGSWDVPCW